METKATKVRSLVAANQIEKAIKMASSFTRDFTKSEQRTIQIAKDILTGHASFYKQLGIDTATTLEQAKALVIGKYS